MESIGPLLSRAGYLLKSGQENAEVLNAAFASNFTSKVCSRASRVLETVSRICGNEAVPTGRKRSLNPPAHTQVCGHR